MWDVEYLLLFFLPSSTWDSLSHNPRHWRRAGEPAAHVFNSFLKTTISWIMTGHVASARSESPKPSASQTKHHGSVRAWTKEETALLDNYREEYREANDTACSHCSHYYTWTLPNVPAGLMHGAGKYPRLGYFPTVSPISLGEAVVRGQWWCALLVTMSGTVFRVQCALPNKEMGAFPNEK